MTTFLRRNALIPLAAAILVLAAACGSSGSGKPAATSGGSGSTSAKLPATTLKGSGSSFQDPFDEEVFRDFTSEAQPNVTVNYNPAGSGQGQTDLEGQLVDFAGSDSLVVPGDVTKFKGGAFLYIPIVSAPITISYNLSGVTKLQLSAATIAKIFSTSITKWDAPEIKADNPGVTLPSTSITVVHRSDGSGTTANFTQYLTEAAASDWTLGTGKTVNWASSTIGAAKNAGVAGKIKSTDGAIGYVDFADATSAQLSVASIKNSSGTFIAPTLAGATAAMAAATVTADVTVSPMNSSGADAYPITSPTYIIVYATQTSHAQGTALKALLEYVLGAGQAKAAALNFAELPPALLVKAKAQVDKIVVP